MQLIPVLQSVPWLWHDMVATRLKLPIWAQSALLFTVLYATSAAAAWYSGVLWEFVCDRNWPITLGLVAFSAYVLGKTPLGVEKLWSHITPWLANSGEEIAAFQRRTRQSLMVMFWPMAFVFVAVVLPFSYLTPGTQLGSAYQTFYGRLNTWLLPVLMYFFGGASALCTFGICTFTWRMNRDLVLKTKFIFKDGKKSFESFNSLLWQIWGTFSIPFLVGVVLLESAAPGAKGDWLSVFNLITFCLILILTLPTILLPQHSMNKWLARLQHDELQDLNRQLERAAEPVTNGDTHEVLLRMHEYNHIDHQIRRVIAFSPTLVDVKFVMEIGSRIFFIVAALVLRNLLSVGPLAATVNL